MSRTTIKSVDARSIFSARGHPGVEAIVTTESGARGVAEATAGVSVGAHEVQFVYDGGERWNGRGVERAVRNVVEVIGPAIVGMDAAKQREVDMCMIALDGTPNKARLGGNAIGAVSAAVLKAAAAALEIPLYQHIGGANASLLPTPAVRAYHGSDRYGGGERAGGKPSVTFVCHGFKSYSEASYAGWQVRRAFMQSLRKRFGIRLVDSERPWLSKGLVKDDTELWSMMVDAIAQAGHEGKVGIQIDAAAGCYWDAKKDRFIGLFTPQEKTRDELIAFYKDAVKRYPILILEDPLNEDDYEGHAILTKALGIEVVGDDLFTTNAERLMQGVKLGAANAMLLKVNQIGSITEAFDVVELAYRHGYGVMPCSSRGEGPDIADYAVGLRTGHIRESGLDPTGNRLLQIERELGPRAKFLGRAGFKP